MQAIRKRRGENSAVGCEGGFESGNTVAFQSEMDDELGEIFICHADVVFELDTDLRVRGVGGGGGCKV